MSNSLRFCQSFVLLRVLSVFLLLFPASKSISQELSLPPINQHSILCDQDLSDSIAAIINRPEFQQARWGILIQGLDSGCTIYRLDADKYFIPASNAKLLTSAAALLELGAEFEIKTPVYAVGKPPYLESLRIQGQGDPSLSTESLKSIVQQLQLLGIKRIEKLIIDDSYFTNLPINPTWEWLDVYSYYGTGVNSLILNENTVTLTIEPENIGELIKLKWSDNVAARQWQVENQGITSDVNIPYSINIDGVLGKPVLKITGKIPINHGQDVWDLAIVEPGNYFLETFRGLLANSGITVTQGIVTNQQLNSEQEIILTTIVSPPLKTLLVEVNQESNNLYAEAILKILGKQLNTETDIEAVQQSLNKLGIDSENYILEDGSGLSRHNLITPQTLVEILTAIANTSEGKTYQESLALGGVNGTVKHRFGSNLNQGNLRVKTGTLSGVTALSGYLEKQSEETLVFSVIVNNFKGENKTARQAIDEIVSLLQKTKE